MKTRDEYLNKLKNDIDSINQQIDIFEVKAKQAGDDMKVKYSDQLANTRVKVEEVKIKLTEMEASSEMAWEEMKVGLENAWLDLKEAFNNAKSHF